MIINIVLLLIGFLLLIKGADFLVDSSGKLASKLGVSDLIIGLTIVAFGTSAPEFIVSIIASLNGNNCIVLGNIIGSNLFNTLAIIGICGTFWIIKIKRKVVLNEIPMFLFLSIMLFLLGNDIINFGIGISRLDGIIMLILFLLFFVYTSIKVKKDDSNNDQDISVEHKEYNNLQIIIYIILGILGLYFGGRFVVDSAVIIAKMLGVSDKIIAVTILAFGTSAPELVASITAIRKNKCDIAIGNIVGSNIFNIGLVLSVSSIINPIVYDTCFNLDLSMFIISTMILISFIYIGKDYILSKKQSVCIFLMYIIYMILIFV